MKRFVLIMSLLAAFGCSDDAESTLEVWTWDLPEGFPTPFVPEFNPMSTDKVELGRLLFYDPLLSDNETQSCGTCHKPELAFTDGLPQGIGSTEMVHPRGSMGLTNIAYSSVLTWGNPTQRELEEQMLGPLFGETPIELGLKNKEQLVERLEASEDYVERFTQVFGEDSVDLGHTTQAIAAFERSLVSTNSPYDRAVYFGEYDAMSAAAKRGQAHFFSERFECFHCHGGFNFSDSVMHDSTVFEEVRFHNNGLYNLGGSGAYPAGNQGIYDITGILEDSGKFKAPTLRNIAVTAPYMHDGTIETLGEVLDHYARGGRLIETGEFAGDGKFSPFKSELVNGFEMSPEEKEELLAFLESLTDETFLNNPAYQDPFQ